MNAVPAAVRRRTASARKALPPALAYAAAAGVALALAGSGSSRPAAQDRTSSAAARAAAEWSAARPAEPALVCGTPELVARGARRGFSAPRHLRMADGDEDEESPYGQPLWFDPQPRLIRADSTEGLAFRDFFVVGDVETLEFERWSSAAGEPLIETWTRTETRTFRGRLVSIFNPAWNETELWDAIGEDRRGFDSPYVYFGALRIPKPRAADEAPAGDAESEEEDFDEAHIRLPAAPLNLPVARVESLGAGVQYASHVVNLVVPGFGGERVDGDDFAQGLENVTQEFYRHFPDTYDSIAVVTADQQPSSEFTAYHWNARNPIRGLGLEEFHNSDYFGSQGALRSVEFYRDASFTTTWTSNHEIGHQWVDYWDWTAITGGIERKGWAPAGHTPLLFPGEVLLGAVLRPIRRVAAAAGGGSAGDDGGAETAYVIERTPAPSLYHPTTLYRMGLVGPEEVPEMVVFEDQGQFSEESATAPDVGAAVEGAGRRVHVNDVIAQHGTRSGPVDSSWRRVTVVVSRSELISVEEMSYWNFFAARHAARSGVTTFGGMPSFYEATGGRVPLETAVEWPSGYRIVNNPPLQVSDAPIDPGEFRGVRLDEPIPGAMTAGARMTFAGRLVSDDAPDVVEVCVRQSHIGGPPDDEGNPVRVVTACDQPAGNRFSIPLAFDRTGRYSLQMRIATRTDDAAEPNETYSSYMTGITVR